MSLEGADEATDNPVAAQLFLEQDRGAFIPSEGAMLEHPSIEEQNSSDNQLAETAVAIINTSSLKRRSLGQEPAIKPVHGHQSGAGPERRKRGGATDVPVSPSKRRQPTHGAKSDNGKLSRPPAVYDNLPKSKENKAVKTTYNVPESPVKAPVTTKAISHPPTDVIEHQEATAKARNSGSGNCSSESKTAGVTLSEAEQETNKGVRGEPPHQRTKSTRGNLKRQKLGKSREGTSTHQPVSDVRQTRSGDHNLRSTGRHVALLDPNWSKKPEDSFKTRNGAKSPGKFIKAPATSRALGEPEISVHVNSGAEVVSTLQKFNNKAPAADTNDSLKATSEVGTPSTSKATEDRPQDCNHVGQDDVDDGGIVDANKRASADKADREEIIDSSRASEVIAVNAEVGSQGADDLDYGLGNQSDGGGWYEVDTDDFATGEGEADDEDSTMINGRPQARIPFEQQARWNKVLESAQSVGLSERNGITEKEKPKLVTKLIKRLIRGSSELRKVYIEYGTLYALRGSMDENSMRRFIVLRDDVNVKLRNLRSSIDKIDETSVGNKRCEVIQDIYAHGIPELVFLLNEIFLCYFSTSSIRDSALRKIQWAVDRLVLNLCRKAVRWIAKPNTKRPIIRFTRQAIFPNMQHVRKIIANELRERERSAERNKQRSDLERRKAIAQRREHRRLEEFERIRDEYLDRQESELDVEEGWIELLRKKAHTGRSPRNSSSFMLSQEDTACEAHLPEDFDTSIERVQVFGRRDDDSLRNKNTASKPIRDHSADDATPLWSEEERTWLLIGLQIYQGTLNTSSLAYAATLIDTFSGDDRYERIMREYGKPGPKGHLQDKSFDDLVQRARWEKSNQEDEQIPDWLRSA